MSSMIHSWSFSIVVLLTTLTPLSFVYSGTGSCNRLLESQPPEVTKALEPKMKVLEAISILKKDKKFDDYTFRHAERGIMSSIVTPLSPIVPHNRLFVLTMKTSFLASQRKDWGFDRQKYKREIEIVDDYIDTLLSADQYADVFRSLLDRFRPVAEDSGKSVELIKSGMSLLMGIDITVEPQIRSLSMLTYRKTMQGMSEYFASGDRTNFRLLKDVYLILSQLSRYPEIKSFDDLDELDLEMAVDYLRETQRPVEYSLRRIPLGIRPRFKRALEETKQDVFNDWDAGILEGDIKLRTKLRIEEVEELRFNGEPYAWIVTVVAKGKEGDSDEVVVSSKRLITHKLEVERLETEEFATTVN